MDGGLIDMAVENAQFIGATISYNADVYGDGKIIRGVSYKIKDDEEIYSPDNLLIDDLDLMQLQKQWLWDNGYILMIYMSGAELQVCILSPKTEWWQEFMFKHPRNESEAVIRAFNQVVISPLKLIPSEDETSKEIIIIIDEAKEVPDAIYDAIERQKK